MDTMKAPDKFYYETFKDSEGNTFHQWSRESSNPDALPYVPESTIAAVVEQAVEAANLLIEEAQAGIYANMKDIMPSRTVENLWLGRKIGAESVKDAIRALAPQSARDALAEHDKRLLAPWIDLLQWAHDTLLEINVSNYDHDDVCRLNDASVEVILGIAPTLGETHGKSPEWWAERDKRRDRERGPMLRNVESDDGFWRSCSGCHETSDGAETGWYPYSDEMKCYLGAGCRECGGLGAVWDSTDYAEMGDFLKQEDDAQNAAIEAAKREERERCALIADGIGDSYGDDETGWFECSEAIAAAIRAQGGEV